MKSKTGNRRITAIRNSLNLRAVKDENPEAVSIFKRKIDTFEV